MYFTNGQLSIWHTRRSEARSEEKAGSQPSPEQLEKRSVFLDRLWAALAQRWQILSQSIINMTLPTCRECNIEGLVSQIYIGQFSDSTWAEAPAALSGPASCADRTAACSAACSSCSRAL